MTITNKAEKKEKVVAVMTAKFMLNFIFLIFLC